MLAPWPQLAVVADTNALAARACHAVQRGGNEALFTGLSELPPQSSPVTFGHRLVDQPGWSYRRSSHNYGLCFLWGVCHGDAWLLWVPTL
jgi:hypothetical protein